ncbi:MAG: TetR/AcrR family transcriptional regulator [Dehalococcoidia bacterium]|nr:TetR/AcrR family transcriptional regulator [Dehalococcoidia bacterium]
MNLDQDAFEPAPNAISRKEQMRARIRAAALDLFARDGFEQTTVRAIAERAGLKDGTLYYYFRSKRDLLNSLWEAPSSGLRDLPVVPVMDGQRLVRLVDVILDTAVEQDRLVRLVVQQTLAGDPIAAALRAQTMAYWRRYLLPHFESNLEHADARLRVDLLVSVILGMVFEVQMNEGESAPAVLASATFRNNAHRLVGAIVPVAPAD